MSETTMTDAERNAAAGGHPVGNCDDCGTLHTRWDHHFDENGMSVGRRVYVRRIGYAQLRELHHDGSVTVRYEDHGGEERIPHGDWVYDPDSPTADPHDAIDAKHRIRSLLERDLGSTFHVDGSGIGPDDASWLRAIYGPFAVTITVELAS